MGRIIAAALATYSGIGHEHCVGKTSSESRNTVLGQSLLVEHSAGKDFGDGIRRSVFGSKARRHEWLRLCIPRIGVINTNHCEKANEEPNRRVGLESEGKGSAKRGDLKKLNMSAAHLSWKVVSIRIASQKTG